MSSAQQAQQPLVTDLKTQNQWKYRKYTEEEITALTTWMNSPQFNKEMVMGDNLWENMKKLSTRVGMYTHPVFEYTENAVKNAMKDVSFLADLKRPN